VVRAWVVAAVVLAGSAWAAPLERFFIMGDGRLALVNAHTNARVDVRYRQPDGTYDETTLAQIRRAFRSAGDEGEGRASLRLIEILSSVQKSSGVRPLTLMSGYRSPDYNEGIRVGGARAAAGSLHTEGLAADVALPQRMLKPLWMKLRAMDCCGAGYYAKEGFLHIDVGRPRFWEPATSRVEEKLSAGNAQLFARTEYDRYAVGEAVVIAVHAMTVPPVRLAREVGVVPRKGEAVRAQLEGGHGCIIVPESSGHVALPEVHGAVGARIVLRTCEPRVRTDPRADRDEPGRCPLAQLPQFEGSNVGPSHTQVPKLALHFWDLRRQSQVVPFHEAMFSHLVDHRRVGP
jgi:uncharacterized protein YcbK (DUF882 family)